MIVPNANFRPNPSRAIFVQGVIDQTLIDRLTPQILSLQGQNRHPITIYIDSPGGSVASAEILLRLLSASNQDAEPRCQLITVVTSKAASAAADLLSSGDYAVAYPGSSILYHGMRNFLNVPVTAEFASFLRENLKLSNDRYAMELVRKSERRFMFRFVTLLPQFEECRQKHQPRIMTELACVLEIITEKLSEEALKVVDQAFNRYKRYNVLLDRFARATTKSKRFQKAKRLAEIEGVIIKAIVDFELSANKGENWRFEDGGLIRLNDDFFLLREYILSAQSSELKQSCLRWADFILTQQELKELEDVSEESRDARKIEKVLPKIRPVWSFFVALCHALQEGENELTATDACWLGLIDEVIGFTEAQPLRYFIELKPDPEPGLQTSETGKAPVPSEEIN